MRSITMKELTLNSDIVAELPCPHSGILTFEDDMPGPNLQAACDVDGFDPRIIESYSAQLFLRKHLNQLHNMFYKPDNGKRSSFLSFMHANMQDRLSISGGFGKQRDQTLPNNRSFPGQSQHH